MIHDLERTYPWAHDFHYAECHAGESFYFARCYAGANTSAERPLLRIGKLE